MVRINISSAAYKAIAETLPFGSVAVEPRSDASEVAIWLDDVWVDRLGAMRAPGEDYSDVILRIATQPRSTT